MLSLDDLIKDLETAKDIAKAKENPNALVSATLAQAKLLGLDKPIIQDKNAEAVDLMKELLAEIESESKEI